MSLDQLKPGQRGRVVAITGTGAIRRRLMDLGIRKGEIVCMVKFAPLRDPLQVSLSHGHFSVRRSEASLIQVEILADNDRE